MYSSRPQIDESTRRQLLDNYLRNQQTQSVVHQTSSLNVSSSTVPQTFHPSQFQVPTDARSISTFSDLSNRSQNIPSNNLVQIQEQRASSSSTNNNLQNMSLVPINDLPDNISIEDFSNLVKKWIELDNWIKKSQEVAKQKRKQKDKLSEVITHYMTRYNIEDLNTSEGKIRCKVRYVKSGVNQKVVKEKITELLKDNEETCNTLITKIFNEREKVEKVSLRRIKIT